MEVEIYAGKCKCKKNLDLRITDVKEKEKDPKSKIIAWIIYGFCKKCNMIYFQGLFAQEEEPVLNRDFMIDYKKEAQGKSKDTL